jgi:hypothetical protein
MNWFGTVVYASTVSRRPRALCRFWWGGVFLSGFVGALCGVSSSVYDFMVCFVIFLPALWSVCFSFWLFGFALSFRALWCYSLYLGA